MPDLKSVRKRMERTHSGCRSVRVVTVFSTSRIATSLARTLLKTSPAGALVGSSRSRQWSWTSTPAPLHHDQSLADPTDHVTSGRGSKSMYCAERSLSAHLGVCSAVSVERSTTKRTGLSSTAQGGLYWLMADSALWQFIQSEFGKKPLVN